ncbi:chitin synthase-domain-containing protein [Chytriomyces sp. MP71]|nr:chitin synthase-domain-containing protein [Chytriomyces sp. MP71]
MHNVQRPAGRLKGPRDPPNRYPLGPETTIPIEPDSSRNHPWRSFPQTAVSSLTRPRHHTATLDRHVGEAGGTLRRTTLNRPDRQPDAGSLRRPKPMMRNAEDAPPSARLGATSNRLSIALPPSTPTTLVPPEGKDPPQFNAWLAFSKLVTCCFFPSLLRCIGKHNAIAQQAWREKFALCVIIFFLCSAVGFLTFGLQATLCPQATSDDYSYFNRTDSGFELSNALAGKVIVRGYLYDFQVVRQVLLDHNSIDINGTNFLGQDLSLLFTPPVFCSSFPEALWSCTSQWKSLSGILPPSTASCPSLDWLTPIPRNKVVFTWSDLNPYSAFSNHTLLVYKSYILNATAGPPLLLPATLLTPGGDITRPTQSSPAFASAAACLQERAIAGHVASTSTGCMASSVILGTSTIVILTLVFTKFFMALYFHWILAPRLVRAATTPPPSPHVVLLVTCYSEGREGVKATLDSLARSLYPDPRKLLFVVCDGVVTGAGEEQSTPAAVVGLLEAGAVRSGEVSYLAIGEGARQMNLAVVYSGHYVCDGHRVATLVIVKCGTAEEASTAKPGNRGKRDSQMILMNFLSRSLFRDKMTRLDYEMQLRIYSLLQIHPSQFDYVLMVDADTEVESPALGYMVAAMQRDTRVMGLCGETRIRNKRDSWVTAIQVFEYYASHHLGKAFESVFGGVTCLPGNFLSPRRIIVGLADISFLGTGCFSMYRIKVIKELDGRCVPLLVNPDIVEEYSENIVLTLHKRNLLLLGEDRFLSTLMLRNFPKRKMLFVPQAVCRTVVPNQFNVLLSQRRRWINSTIHNLMELLLVRELCGIFCFSMQFVVFLELVGTVVLPAAISFTIFLLIQTAVTGQVQLIPMLLLLFILGLPGILIVLTSRKLVYVGWMAIYMVSLPIWNFVLPLYAFWHFDDFSWGQTRPVDGETRKGGEKDGGHGGEAGSLEFDTSAVDLLT